MSLEILFHNFYINFRCLDILTKYLNSKLINELKDQLLSRMIKIIIDISSIAIILNNLSKYLIKLNNQQRYFIKVKLLNNRINILISKIIYVLLENARIINITIISTSTMQINFKILRENTSASID